VLNELRKLPCCNPGSQFVVYQFVVEFLSSELYTGVTPVCRPHTKLLLVT